jgi:hypothetical protein
MAALHLHALPGTRRELKVGLHRRCRCRPGRDLAGDHSQVDPARRPLAELAERLRSRELRTAVATAPDGKLLGVVRRIDMEARLGGQR